MACPDTQEQPGVTPRVAPVHGPVAPLLNETDMPERVCPRRGEHLARLRRLISLQALLAEGMSQKQVANALGVSQSAISQQSRSAPDLAGIDPSEFVEAGAPILKALAAEHGFTRLAVFGSVAQVAKETEVTVHRSARCSPVGQLVSAVARA